MRTPRTFRLTIALATAALLAACGGGAVGESTGPSGSADGGDAAPLAGASFALGTKGFTEHFILTEATRLLLEDAGASVTIRDLPATEQLRNALLGGDVDLYWEYTGTAWSNFLGHEGVPEGVAAMELYDTVGAEDREQNGVVWLPPADINNTYAIAIRSEAAEEIGVTTLGDFAELLERDPAAMTLCVDTTFADRPDGLPAIEETYGFTWPADQITVSDYALVYPSVDEGQPCNFGEVYATDGRVVGLDLTLIEDPEGAFLSYLPAPLMLEDTYENHGEVIAELLAPMTDALDQETITALNARVDVDGEFPEQVAEDWLREDGLLG